MMRNRDTEVRHEQRFYEDPFNRAQLGLGVIALEGFTTVGCVLAEAANSAPPVAMITTMATGFGVMVATGVAVTRSQNRK